MDKQLVIGISAGILTAIAATPQIIRVLRTKEVDQISTTMFFILAAGNAAWCWYGFMLKDWPIIVTNSFSLIMDFTMLVLKAVYNKKNLVK